MLAELGHPLCWRLVCAFSSAFWFMLPQKKKEPLLLKCEQSHRTPNWTYSSTGIGAIWSLLFYIPMYLLVLKFHEQSRTWEKKDHTSTHTIIHTLQICTMWYMYQQYMSVHICISTYMNFPVKIMSVTHCTKNQFDQDMEDKRIMASMKMTTEACQETARMNSKETYKRPQGDRVSRKKNTLMFPLREAYSQGE